LGQVSLTQPLFRAIRPIGARVNRGRSQSRVEPSALDGDLPRLKTGAPATEWQEGGWMIAQPTGKPIDPRRDQHEWKALLEEAGAREARLHDARHTAATTLLLLGIHEP
jgi:integrase